MSAPNQPDNKPAGSPASGEANKRSTVGVYDRPAAADRPNRLPQIITAVIVVLMLVLTWLFWPRAAAASVRHSQPAAVSSAVPASQATGPEAQAVESDWEPGCGSAAQAAGATPAAGLAARSSLVG